MGCNVEYKSFSFDPIISNLPFKLDDNILYVEYESFFCEFNIHGGSDDGFYANYESFSFDSIQTDFLFEYYKSKFVEFEMIATKNLALDQTHAHILLNRLVNLAPPIFPRLLVHDDIVSRPMTSILACFEYVNFLSDWAQLFAKLNKALTCTLLARWMYSF